jgi:hypothetical protein
VARKLKPETIDARLSELMGEVSRLRWARMTEEQRKAAGKALAKSRKKIPKAKRSEIASHAASSITPSAASERARKAWETKRAKAAAKSRKRAG